MKIQGQNGHTRIGGHTADAQDGGLTNPTGLHGNDDGGLLRSSASG